MYCNIKREGEGRDIFGKNITFYYYVMCKKSELTSRFLRILQGSQKFHGGIYFTKLQDIVMSYFKVNNLLLQFFLHIGFFTIKQHSPSVNEIKVSFYL